MTERTLKIEQRLHHVKRELCEQGISKSKQTNFGGKYKYRGVDSTMGTVSALHAKYGVNFSIDRIEHFAVAQQGNNTHITCLFVFRFSSCDDKSEYVEHTCIGEGLDQGDKASGKAHSYAYKNGMFSFYEIPVEGQNVDDYDPRIDNEDDSDEIPIPMPQNVKDEIDKHKPEPKKETHAEQVKEVKAEHKKKKDHMKLTKKEEAEERLSNASSALAQFISTKDYTVQEGEQMRKNLVDILNEDRKILELSGEKDKVIRGLLGEAKSQIENMKKSASSDAVAKLAQKNAEAIG
tara:strand:+ start:1125 stop:2000 length:876 start_codon:yes stop_codon:yes gene_type:complete